MKHTFNHKCHNLQPTDASSGPDLRCRTPALSGHGRNCLEGALGRRTLSLGQKIFMWPKFYR